MITGTDVTVWTISGLLAIGIGWSAYAKRKTRDKLVRELAAMEPDRRAPRSDETRYRSGSSGLPKSAHRRIRQSPPLRITEARLTAAILPAIAFLVIVHGAVLAGFLAALRFCCEASTANRSRQNREQNFGVILHGLLRATRNDASAKIGMAP